MRLLAQKPILGADWANMGTLVKDIGELILQLDRARRVVLGTAMEQLEHVSERIQERITRIW